MQNGGFLDTWLMQESNLEKWEGKMTASDRRVLLSNLVGEANKLVLHDDDMRVNCFVRTGCLLEYEQSQSDDLVKPQGVHSKIIVPATHADSPEEINESMVPTTAVMPEEDLEEDAGICEDTAGEEDTNELVVNEEGDADLNIHEILQDVSVCESDDEIDPNHFVF